MNKLKQIDTLGGLINKSVSNFPPFPQPSFIIASSLQGNAPYTYNE